MKLSILLGILLCLPCAGQTITETFGTGANAFSIEFVEIGNPGNTADTTGHPDPAGSVSYVYNIGKYEISRNQIEKANLSGNLGINLFDMSSFGGNGPNKPATLNWFMAAKYVNWLNTSTGNHAAYKIDESGNFQLWNAGDVGYQENNLFRNSLSKYFLPSADEWYKAAYGSLSGTWYNFPTSSDNGPTAVSGGTLPNTAVYARPYWSQGPADIDNAGGLSAFGTMAQGGNVWEWTESAFDGVNDNIAEDRMYRGSGYAGTESPFLSSSSPALRNPEQEPEIDRQGISGFRIASVPEPSSLSLLLVGGVVLMAGGGRGNRIKKQD